MKAPTRTSPTEAISIPAGEHAAAVDILTVALRRMRDGDAWTFGAWRVTRGQWTWTVRFSESRHTGSPEVIASRLYWAAREEEESCAS